MFNIYVSYIGIRVFESTSFPASVLKLRLFWLEVFFQPVYDLHSNNENTPVIFSSFLAHEEVFPTVTKLSCLLYQKPDNLFRSFSYRRGEISYYKGIREQKREIIPYLFQYFLVMMGIQMPLLMYYNQEVKGMKNETSLEGCHSNGHTLLKTRT